MQRKLNLVSRHTHLLNYDKEHDSTPKLKQALGLVRAHKVNVSLWTVESHKIIAENVLTIKLLRDLMSLVIYQTQNGNG